MNSKSTQPVLLIGVTVGMSLVHHLGLPELLRRRGWRVVVVTSPSPESERLREEGIEVVDLAMERNPSPLRDGRALWKWLRTLKRIRPDAVIIGTPKASLLGLVAACLTRVPVRIYMLHGLRLETSSGAMLSVLTFLEKLTAGASTNVLAVSESLMERAVSLNLVPRHKIQVLGSGSSNGVGWFPRTFGANAQERVGLTPVVGFVGRINVDKGFADLLGAFDLLDDCGFRYSSLVVGTPEGAAGKDLLENYQSRGGNHAYVGFVDDVGAQYARMSLLALPSHREGLGMVVLEAGACGVPAVVSDATGVRDSVVDGVTGWIYPVGDVGALAATLREALSGPDELWVRGLSAHNRVGEEFSQPVVQTRLVNFIEKVALG